MSRIGTALSAAKRASVTAILCACSADSASDGWTGTADTLSSGQIVVANPSDPIWPGPHGWEVAEEWRIGRGLEEGPDAFGQIRSFEVDSAGRIWILDGIAKNVRAFDASGDHITTMGREGEGPGEFTRPEHIELGPDGSLWIVDVGINRMSRFATNGHYLDSRTIPSGYPITPWLGGFDASGHFYVPIADTPTESEQVAFTFVRHDRAFVPIDTVRRPIDRRSRATFEFRGAVGRVPLQGSLVWQVTDEGTVLALLTDDYRLIEFSPGGDTLRTITRSSEPIPVSESDRQKFRSAWAPYTPDGGLPDWWSDLPKTKPPVSGFFFRDSKLAVWVERQPDSETGGRTFDIFDREGRFLGPVDLPYALARHPPPVVRGPFLYGVARDEMGVDYFVKLRIVEGEH